MIVLRHILWKDIEKWNLKIKWHINQLTSETMRKSL